MPELRKDPIVGRWVIVATERARRPGNFVDPVNNQTESKDCPFCQDKGSEEIFAFRKNNEPNWRVRVLKSGTPLFSQDKTIAHKGAGLYDVCYSYGAHEVVIETPQHIANMADLEVEQIKNVFETYAIRMNHHKNNPDFEYVLAYKNYGADAGSRRIGHSRSQIMATSVNPIQTQDFLAGVKRYYDYHERCVFCDMIHQERKSNERVVVESAHFIALAPFASRFPFEVWILPKKHCCDFTQGVAGNELDLAWIMKEILLKYKIGLNDAAYNYVVQSAPLGIRKLPPYKKRSIEENYHWHIEVTPRLTRVAGFEKGSGFYICSIPPEQTARFLREVKI